MGGGTTTRHLSDADARRLGAGAEHYTAFVGPPDQYDLMGATQFRLLTTLGLRDHHRVLDFGCGSLRLGRLLIPYLRRGNYHGLEPNEWLIEDAIDRQLGRDLVGLKWPHFHVFDDFRAGRCGLDFDFIVAQSIFSHAGGDLVKLALHGFSRALAKTGLALATFVHPGQAGVAEFAGSGWVYPASVGHAPATIAAILHQAGLFGRALPWFHPRQTWYVLSRDAARLPERKFDPHLRGAVLGVPAWEPSL
ncbi:MAG: class I SAM-dependent methyltransferase [Stellaceae bacterium]